MSVINLLNYCDPLFQCLVVSVNIIYMSAWYGGMNL